MNLSNIFIFMVALMIILICLCNKRYSQKGGMMQWMGWTTTEEPRHEPPSAVAVKEPRHEPTSAVVDDLLITEHCCGDRPTQFPRKMSGCEDAGHTGIALATRAAESAVGEIGSSFDGVVSIKRQSRRPSPDIKSEVYYTGDLTIADHDPIITTVDGNIFMISHNIEGLCKYKISEYKGDSQIFLQRLRNYGMFLVKLKELIGDYRGLVFVYQELVLQERVDQQGMKNQANELLTQLATSIQDVFGILSVNTRTHYDDYTGGVVVVSRDNQINLTNILEVRRRGDQTQDKKSNIYELKYTFEEMDYTTYLCNIHLKAHLRASFTGVTWWVPGMIMTPMEGIHDREIVYILESLYSVTERFNKLDSYSNILLMGDFNNPTSKLNLIKNNISKVTGDVGVSDVEYVSRNVRDLGPSTYEEYVLV